MSRRRLAITLMLLMLTVLVVGCGGDDDSDSSSSAVEGEPASAEDLEAQPWRLKSYKIAGADDLTAASEDDPATATFASGQVSGSTGCNQYNGPYELGSDGRIEFGAVAVTQRACDDTLYEQELGLTDGFGEVARAVIADGDLQLLDDRSNPVLLFSVDGAE